MEKAKGAKYKFALSASCLLPRLVFKKTAWFGQLILRSFSPLASAFWHSGQRYSNSDLVSESTSLWIIRAYRKRVALLHLAQVTYVSEMAVSRVPRTSSCMSDTCLSFMFQELQTMVKAVYLPTRTPTRCIYVEPIAHCKLAVFLFMEPF